MKRTKKNILTKMVKDKNVIYIFYYGSMGIYYVFILDIFSLETIRMAFNARKT